MNKTNTYSTILGGCWHEKVVSFFGFGRSKSLFSTQKWALFCRKCQFLGLLTVFWHHHRALLYSTVSSHVALTIDQYQMQQLQQSKYKDGGVARRHLKFQSYSIVFGGIPSHPILIAIFFLERGTSSTVEMSALWKNPVEPKRLLDCREGRRWPITDAHWTFIWAVATSVSAVYTIQFLERRWNDCTVIWWGIGNRLHCLEQFTLSCYTIHLHQLRRALESTAVYIRCSSIFKISTSICIS